MKLNFTMRPKENFRLNTAILTTFDFEPNTFFSLPFTMEEFHRFLVFCGEGMEQYDDPPEESEAYACLNRIRIPVQFDKRPDGLSSGYLHGKIILQEYTDETGQYFYHLVIQSANLTGHDNLETVVEYTGKRAGSVQEKTKPLIQYLQDLSAYIPENAEFEERGEQMERLIRHLSYVCFEPVHECQNDGWSFLYGNAIRETLFQPCDEMIAVCPFIQDSVLEQLKAAAGKLTVVSGTPMIMSLLKQGITDVEFVPVSPKKTYLHAKLYLRRTGSSWQIVSGSANLTEYSLTRNMEFMEMHSGSYEAEDIQRWLAEFPQETAVPHMTDAPFTADDSGIFIRAAQMDTRNRYLRKVLNRKKVSDRQKERIVEYVLSNACINDLADLLHMKLQLAVPEQLSGPDGRLVFHYPFRDKILLELLNESIHESFDGCFSAHVYSHLRGRHFHNIFTLIRKTPGFRTLYLYKTDIAKFDPTIPEHVIKEKLKHLPGMDAGLLRVLETVIDTERGILPAVKTGCPLSGFFENVILREIDTYLECHAVFYTRFADDILIGTETKEELERLIRKLNQMLSELGLAPNITKSMTACPGESLTYLGWNIENGETDFTEKRLHAMKKEILRVQKQQLILLGKNKMDQMFRLYLGVNTAKRLEKQLQLENTFRIISKADGLKQIDRWISDMIRVLASGKTGIGKYRVSRSELHRWGYRSLVVRYYDKISIRR